LWALILQRILSDNLTDLIWGVNRIHKLALQAFVSVTLVGLYDIFPHKEALFISVDNVSSSDTDDAHLHDT
jgi:hypothetical protein